MKQVKTRIQNRKLQIIVAGVLLPLLAITTHAQMAVSHTPTIQPPAGNLPAAQMQTPVVNDMPVVRVNGTALTNRDLVREMFAIFPYGKQHNGFPKSMVPEIRKGALEMIIFEELLYQEGLRRKVAIPPASIDRAYAQFRKQFSSPAQFQEYLKFECKGSQQVLRQKIRRSLLIESVLKSEVQDKAVVTTADMRAYYQKNSLQFEHGESFSIQTISIMPPQNAGADVQAEARKRAEEALKQAKATKTYREFGLVAEKMSDDDWHVNLGDRKVVEAAKLPPPVVEAARKLKVGEVSDLIQLGPFYTVIRLNAHTPAGKAKFEDVKTKLRSDLQKAKVEQTRNELNRRLRKTAKVEVL